MDKAKTTKELDEILMHTDSEEDLKSTFHKENSIRDDLSFADYYNALEKVKGMNRADLINRSLIDRTYGYQILNGRRHPSRDKVIALSLAAGLDETETRRALMCEGYAALYARNRRDAVLIYALRHRLGVMETNSLLVEFEEKILQ